MNARRDLRHDQRVAQDEPPPAACRAPSAFLQCLDGVPLRRLERREDTEQDPGDERQRREEEEDAQIDADGRLRRQEEWRQLREDAAEHERRPWRGRRFRRWLTG